MNETRKQALIAKRNRYAARCRELMGRPGMSGAFEARRRALEAFEDAVWACGFGFVLEDSWEYGNAEDLMTCEEYEALSA